MHIPEKEYKAEEYDALIRKLVQSTEVDDDFHFINKSLLHQNPLFYTLAFKTVEKIKSAAISTDDKRLISDLEDFEEVLMKYTNILPVDLPDLVLADRDLVGRFLADNSLVGFNSEEWSKFKNKIFGHLEILSGDKKSTFLEWCTHVLNMNWDRHKETCDSPNCGQDRAYERRLGLITKEFEEIMPISLTPLPAPPNSPIQDSGIRLDPRKGPKIDLIRIINAMWELGFFKNQDGFKPSKKDVMKAVGTLFGIDLSNYDKDLSQAFQNSGIEANIKIFKDLEEVTKNKIV